MSTESHSEPVEGPWGSGSSDPSEASAPRPTILQRRLGDSSPKRSEVLVKDDGKKTSEPASSDKTTGKDPVARQHEAALSAAQAIHAILLKKRRSWLSFGIPALFLALFALVLFGFTANSEPEKAGAPAAESTAHWIAAAVALCSFVFAIYAIWRDIYLRIDSDEWLFRHIFELQDQRRAIWGTDGLGRLRLMVSLLTGGIPFQGTDIAASNFESRRVELRTALRLDNLAKDARNREQQEYEGELALRQLILQRPKERASFRSLASASGPLVWFAGALFFAVLILSFFPKVQSTVEGGSAYETPPDAARNYLEQRQPSYAESVSEGPVYPPNGSANP